MVSPRTSSTDLSNSALNNKTHLFVKFVRKGMIVTVGFAILVALYSLYWFILATNLRDGITSWLKEGVSQGYPASYQRIEVSGYPTTFRFILSRLSISAPVFSSSEVEMKWNWRGSRVIAEVKPWNLDKLWIDLSGNHHISFETVKGNYRYTGAIDHLILEMELFDDGLPEQTSVVAKGLVFTLDKTNQKFTTRNLKLMAERIFPAAVSSKTPTFDMKLTVEDFNLPMTQTLPLGHTVKHLGASIQILGKLHRPFDVGALTKWRDKGGIIEFEFIEARYGPLNLLLNGTLALDEKLQILAAFTAKVEGFLTAIDQFKQARVIQPRDAALAKVMFGAFSKRSPDSKVPNIELPLNIQDGRLTINDLKILNIPHIRWAQPTRQPDGFRHDR